MTKKEEKEFIKTTLEIIRVTNREKVTGYPIASQKLDEAIIKQANGYATIINKIKVKKPSKLKEAIRLIILKARGDELARLKSMKRAELTKWLL